MEEEQKRSSIRLRYCTGLLQATASFRNVSRVKIKTIMDCLKGRVHLIQCPKEAFCYCGVDAVHVLHDFWRQNHRDFLNSIIWMFTKLMLFHCLVFSACCRPTCAKLLHKGLLQMRQYVTMESVYSTKRNADEMLKKQQSQSAHRSSML